MKPVLSTNVWSVEVIYEEQGIQELFIAVARYLHNLHSTYTFASVINNFMIRIKTEIDSFLPETKSRAFLGCLARVQ